MGASTVSMTVSHANDIYFWVVSQFSGMDTSVAYKCQTGVTLAQGGLPSSLSRFCLPCLCKCHL